MSDTRKRTDSDIIREVNELDKELGATYTTVDELSSAPYITKVDYDAWHANEYTGIRRALTGLFVSQKDSPEAQLEVNFLKTLIQGTGSDQDRFKLAQKQIGEIEANPKASSAEKEYAYKLKKLVTIAQDRMLALQPRNSPSKK